MKKSLSSVLIAALAVCLLAAGAFAGELPKKVGLCIPEAATDKGWNEQAAIGLEKTAKKYGFAIEMGEALGYGDIKPTLRDMVKKGCDMIVTHASGYQTVAPEVAAETGVKMTIIESEKGQKPGLVQNVDTKGAPGAYLAGYLAGKMTRSGTVGICSSAESPTWNRMTCGFAQGVKDAKPDSKILYSLIGEAAYADAAGAKRNSEDMIAAGADIIFGMGDGASFGMLQACSSKKAKDGGKVWFIDVIGDKKAIDKADVLLTSVLFDFSVVYDQIMQWIKEDKFGEQTAWVSVPSGAVYLLTPNKAVPEALVAEVEALRQKIAAGGIDVTSIPEPPKMHEYLKSLSGK